MGGSTYGVYPMASVDEESTSLRCVVSSGKEEVSGTRRLVRSSRTTLTRPDAIQHENIVLETSQLHFTCQVENNIRKDNSPEGYLMAGKLGETGE